MSSRDSKGRCTLFEWQLRSCNYGLPEIRPAGSQTEPLDCAIDILRRGSVQAAQVPGYVRELDTCLANVPAALNTTCYVALGLLHNEIAEWKKEASLKDDVEVVRQELQHVTAQGGTALEQQEREQPAIEALERALEKAEPLPGHYLVNEVRAARTVLNNLLPIPALQKELVHAEADAKHAFETTSLWRVKEAIVWLNVSVRRAEKYHLSEPVRDGRQALHDLGVLKAALLDLKHAKFQANVSIGTRSGVPETLAMLNSSIHKAQAAGLTNGMLAAHSLLRRLQLLQDAVQASRDSTATAAEILAVAGNKGEHSLLGAASALNASLVQAENLGLGDNSSVAEARGAYDKILYILHARRALQDAVAKSQEVLDHNGAMLLDDEEEAAISSMAPAVAWGEEVGLVNGLDVAQLNADQLLAVERAKENMTWALEVGNATIEAKTRVPEAITLLESTVAGSLQANTSAGVSEAKDELQMLRAIWDARVNLEAATNQAREAMRSRTGYDQAEAALNVSGHRAEAVGLDDDARLAAEQATHLAEFARADQLLAQSLAEKPQPRGPPRPVKPADPEPNVTFRRDGLAVVALPVAPETVDDGDRDFDEHVSALATAIEDAEQKGSVDPKMQAAYESALGMRAAHEQLMTSVALGEAALASKEGITGAVAALTTALRAAHERGLAVDVDKASGLYAELSKIPPAFEKIRGAMLSVNVSIRTTSGMDGALLKIQNALELNRQLSLTQYVPAAEKLRADLLVIKEAFVGLRAATMQGQITLENESGEEAAIAELGRAIAIAHQAGLTKGIENAQELHDELEHMSSQHNKLLDAMTPPISS